MMTERERLEAIEKLARKVQGKVAAAFAEDAWKNRMKSNTVILDQAEAELIQRAVQRYADDMRKRVEKRERKGKAECEFRTKDNVCLLSFDGESLHICPCAEGSCALAEKQRRRTKGGPDNASL